jgi:hypothetical protein
MNFLPFFYLPNAVHKPISANLRIYNGLRPIQYRTPRTHRYAIWGGGENAFIISQKMIKLFRIHPERSCMEIYRTLHTVHVKAYLGTLKMSIDTILSANYPLS